MIESRFIVPGIPVAQQRHRQRYVQPKEGPGFIHNYDPTKSREWKAKVALFARDAGVPLRVGPVQIAIDVYLPRPQSVCRKKDPTGPVPCFTGKDADNLGKGVCDALNGIAWNDDKQVCDFHVRKFFHEIGGVPRTEILIRQAQSATATSGEPLPLALDLATVTGRR